MIHSNSWHYSILYLIFLPLSLTFSYKFHQSNSQHIFFTKINITNMLRFQFHVILLINCFLAFNNVHCKTWSPLDSSELKFGKTQNLNMYISFLKMHKGITRFLYPFYEYYKIYPVNKRVIAFCIFKFNEEYSWWSQIAKKRKKSINYLQFVFYSYENGSF